MEQEPGRVEPRLGLPGDDVGLGPPALLRVPGEGPVVDLDPRLLVLPHDEGAVEAYGSLDGQRPAHLRHRSARGPGRRRRPGRRGRARGWMTHKWTCPRPRRCRARRRPRSELGRSPTPRGRWCGRWPARRPGGRCRSDLGVTPARDGPGAHATRPCRPPGPGRPGVVVERRPSALGADQVVDRATSSRHLALDLEATARRAGYGRSAVVLTAGIGSVRPMPTGRPRSPEGRARRRRPPGRRVPGTAPSCARSHHANPYELLAATILSAQTTDERVNMVTPALFAKYPPPEDLAAADPAEVEELVRSTGFFRNKTKSLMGMARRVVERFGGEVPTGMSDLVTLPGVGRKTGQRGPQRGHGRARAAGRHPRAAAVGPARPHHRDRPGEDRDDLNPRGAGRGSGGPQPAPHPARPGGVQGPQAPCDACVLADICPSAFRA